MIENKKFLVALAVSVGLNLFLLGGIAARAGRAHHAGPHPPNGAGEHDGPPPHARGRGFPGSEGAPDGWRGRELSHSLVRALGGPNDPRVRKIRDERKADMKEFREKAHAARERVESALHREPFDAAAFETALREADEATAATQTRARASLVELAKALTPDERRRLESPARSPALTRP